MTILTKFLTWLRNRNRFILQRENFRAVFTHNRATFNGFPAPMTIIVERGKVRFE